VLKPGGYLLAFSAARTYHHLASNIESVGFEIRDQLMWLYASGFPKAQDIGKAIDKRAGKYDTNYGTTTTQTQERGINTHGAKGMGSRKCNRCQKDVAHQYECDDTECGMKYNYGSEEAQQWAGWKTALKPAHEPIVMARKPFKGSTIDNVLQHGVGALNIDATRINWSEKDLERVQRENAQGGWRMGHGIKKYAHIGEDIGATTDTIKHNEQGRFPSNVMGEIEGYQKFFYCPKVSRKERHCGFEVNKDTQTKDLPNSGIEGDFYSNNISHNNPANKKDPLAHIEKLSNYSQGDVKNHPLWDPSIGTNLQRLKHKILEHEKTLGREHPVTGAVGNNHPTVKPVALMRYLIQLVVPKNSIVLDPFTGSGSTGMAACELGHTFVGCELDPRYVDIAKRRIEGWLKPQDTSTYEALFEDE